MSYCHTLFDSNTKCVSHREASFENKYFHSHSRSMSTSSASSTSSSIYSSTESHARVLSYDPLSLHPPLCLNASPVLSEDDECHDGASHHGRRRHCTSNHSGDGFQGRSEECSNERDVCFNQDKRRRTYVYDQQLQWPLKDWQAVPPGLAGMGEEDYYKAHDADSRTSNSPSQRRPPREDIGELDTFVKRGEWKRRGIVFQLTSEAEDEQTEHFELPDRGFF